MKRSLLSIALITGVCAFTNAQTFVSTTPENKNVVLEEFTGIYCTYCPDGHKIAQQLADDNPNDVVLVNIHVGGYADPGTSGDPDFRTSFGTAIKDQAQLTGYPAGTINRHPFPNTGPSSNPSGTGQSDCSTCTAMSRGYWTTSAGISLGESSYVNIAAEATINYTTRVLTVDVEAYYTANGTGINNINVALLQNNVEGPQTGATSFNPGNILPNGNYNHQHMLRHLLSGQWGTVTTATTSGTTFTNQYTYTIPADLNGVDYNLFDLEVVVYIAEGQQEIISGNKASMDLVMPPGVSLVDLSASTNMTMPASYCDANVTPEITVTNNSSMTVDTFEVNYVLDGGAPVVLAGTSSLAPSGSATITFPAIVLTSGSHTIDYSVNLGAAIKLIDNVSGNNAASSGTINTISAVAFATSHSEGFESYSSGTKAIDNAIVINDNAENTYVVSNAVGGPSVTWPLGGYGNSDQSWRMRFYTWAAGSEATIVFENIDLSTNWGNGLRFSYAYAQYINENDRLEVNVSDDCGATWTNVFDKAGSALSTAAPYSDGHYYPAIAEWDSANISLAAFDGLSSVMIAFKGTGDYGNNLYIDDINIHATAGGTPPVANFSASSTSICEGGTVTFTDLSTNTPTQWAWTFTGGTPNSSANQNPTVVYNSAGTYTVSLTAINGDGGNTKTTTSMIIVNAPTVTGTSTDAACGSCDGTATASGANGGHLSSTKWSYRHQLMRGLTFCYGYRWKWMYWHRSCNCGVGWKHDDRNLNG